MNVNAAVMLTLAAAVWTGSTGQRSPAPPIAVTGELRQWHKVTLTVDGPQTSETAASPNPFTDYRMNVTFTHESGTPAYTVPGYFAGDGNAANTSATAGNKWRAHLAPDKTGRWTWRMSFVSGRGVATDLAAPSQPVAGLDGATGTLQIAATNKTAPDFRARGRLQYVGKHYLQFAGTGEYFIKVGADAPETLLAYADFDGTVARKPQVPLHTYGPHVQDWKTGDPTWKDGKGKGLIGAANYLSSKGANSMSFLPYNAGGDGDNVWPFVERDDKFHYDVSKLDQWQIFFDHAQQKGLHLHFKLQETENDDNNRGNPYPTTPSPSRGARAGGEAPRGGGGGAAPGGQAPGARARGPAPTGPVVESLDGGDLGPERKLYVRELIARYGYLLALNWNLGEENTQSNEQQRAMSQYIKDTDPYVHHIVVHTFPNTQEAIYTQLLAPPPSALTGASLQNEWDTAHERTLRWVTASDAAGKPWVVATDEQGPANLGAPPDVGYAGFTGKNAQGADLPYTLHEIRKFTLWGNLMAGGDGAEYYFGYQLPDNDLIAENFRSRDKSWDYGRIAIEFFRTQKIPVTEMKNCDELVGNTSHDNSRYCFGKTGELYLVYLPAGGQQDLNLAGASGQFSVSWFDPRTGGALKKAAVTSVRGGGSVSLGAPPDSPTEDWLVVLRRN
jgi:hypothetical protein